MCCNEGRRVIIFYSSPTPSPIHAHCLVRAHGIHMPMHCTLEHAEGMAKHGSQTVLCNDEQTPKRRLDGALAYFFE